MRSTNLGLFETRDITAAISRAGAGFVLLVVGWYQASNQLLLADQAPWLALAAAGTMLAAAGGILWILGLRRAVPERLALVRFTIHALPSDSTTDDGQDDTIVVRVAVGSRLFHRADCVLISGRNVVPATQDERDGRLPCGACVDV